MMVMVVDWFFFFSSRRRHTRYWRDWSSDVCSSDLGHAGGPHGERQSAGAAHVPRGARGVRSEERRVGKECRCRRPPYHQKKKIIFWMLALIVDLIPSTAVCIRAYCSRRSVAKCILV